MQITTLATTVLLMLITTFNTAKAYYTCYSSSAPKAQQISSVYDDHHTMGDFWYRNGSQLVPCTFSSIYSSKCSVCLNDSAVLVVLCNLTSSVSLVMEGPDGHISFNRTDCPQPETIRGRFGLFISLATFIILLIIIIIVIIVIIRLKCKRQNSQTPDDGPHSVSSGPGPDVEMDLLGPVLSDTRGVAEGCLENL